MKPNGPKAPKKAEGDLDDPRGAKQDTNIPKRTHWIEEPLGTP